MSTSLVPVISVDSKKCVNCHRCIVVCPSKFCNDGSSDHIRINHDLCIGCGACIKACKHGARKGIDDFDVFLDDLKSGQKIVAVVAPAAAANFKGRDLELNTWLKSIGVKAVFDVSFGAELTTKSYIEYIKANNPKLVIAQPCPALISYVEIYKPELLPYLSPADSPMAHTVRMVKEFYPEYKDYKFAAISPCYAKKREFAENHLGDYNVTMKSISEYFEQKRVDLSTYPKTSYDNSPAEKAVLYSTPGGLMRTAEGYLPGISKKIRKIEGQPTMTEYFEELSDSIQKGKELPYQLIDCLNCERGCNDGAGTVNKDESLDEIEGFVEKRMKERQALLKTDKRNGEKKFFRLVNEYWKPNIYNRTYVNRCSNFQMTIRYPSEIELKEIYAKMLKTKPEDFLNCGACGYDSCEEMAVALYNGINQYNHCYYYMLKLNEIKQKNDNELYQSVQDLVVSTKEGIESFSKNLDQLHSISENNTQSIKKITELNNELKDVDEIVSFINSIADDSKIIAFNAELEASSAGAVGKNFHIVAAEIRRLSDGIIDYTKDIKAKIQTLRNFSEGLIDTCEQGTEKIEFECSEALKIKEQFDRISEATNNLSASAEKL